LNRSWQRAVERSIAATAGAQWTSSGRTGWGEAWTLRLGTSRFFVKTATGRYADMLDAEADGLSALAGTRTIRVPEVIASGSEGGTTFLVLEWLEMHRSRDGAAMGRALAALHRAVAPAGPAGERFGWHRDNWIGGTPQINGWSDNWCAFFRERRLAPQFELAARNGHRGALQRDGEKLLSALPDLLRGHDPAPSLLHGDLWSGNAATLGSDEPIVFDPAVYVGDREADLAMTELFGGFDRDFYAAYGEAWPVTSGYAARRELYNLYHVLNHLNLFGGAYLAQAETMIAALLAAARSR
jgi:protein-ribulosamine 3-kinase